MVKKISSGYHIDKNGQVSRKGDVTLKTPINVEKYSDLSSLDLSDGDLAIVAEKTTIDGNVYPNNTSFIKNNGEWIPLSGYASAEDVAKFNEIDNKVDKEDGKGLSTNDFTNGYKVKLDNLVTPMQIKGRKDTVDELPIDANIGDVWLVGEQGSEDFEEYLCVEVSGSEQSAVWENVGHTKNTPDWNENDLNSRNYIDNRTHYDGYLNKKVNNSTSEGQFYFSFDGDEKLEIGELYDIECIVNVDGEIMTLTYENIQGSLYNQYDETGCVVSCGQGAIFYSPTFSSEGHNVNGKFSGNPNLISFNITGNYIKQLDSKYIKNDISRLKNLVDGNGSGLRGIYTEKESSNYTLGGCSTTLGSGTKAIGNCSISVGTENIAYGDNSFASGNRTLAHGFASSANGFGDMISCTFTYVSSKTFTVSTNNDISRFSGAYVKKGENFYKISSLSYNSSTRIYTVIFDSTNIGTNTFTGIIYTNQAGDSYSTTEGNENLALGFASHAEGYRTVSSEYFSHAEGNECVASGMASHAEGTRTISSGMYSHAEGNVTVSSGMFSHAEGSQTLAAGQYSHAEGWADYKTITIMYRSSSTYIDNNTWPRVTKYRVIYYIPGNYSYLNSLNISFSINGVNTKPSISYSNGETLFYFNLDSDYTGSTLSTSISGNIASGMAAHTEGHNNLASGFCSHAEGENNVSSAYYSHSEGNNNLASGYGSHAEGSGGYASHQYSHIEGYGNKETLNLTYVNTNTFSTSGYDSKTYLINAKLVYNNQSYTISSATSYYSSPNYITTFTIPNLNVTNNITVDVYNHVAGNEYAHVEGLRNQAYGADSHAEGSANIIDSSGMHSHAEGYNNKVTSYCSHAEGSTNIINGQLSHAEGLNNIIFNSYSHAEGEKNIIYGYDTHVEGRHELSDLSTLTYVGSNKFSIISDYEKRYLNYKYVFIPTESSNSIHKIISAEETTMSGWKYKTTFTFNDLSSYSSDISVKFLNSYINSSYSHIEGYENGVYANNSHVEGSYNTVNGEYTHINGFNNIANGKYLNVFGTYNIEDQQITNIPSWVSRTQYNVGDKVNYNECLYSCSTSNSDYSFDESKWLLISKYTGYNYVEIVGNGTSNTNRSNARTLDWYGSEILSGDLTIGASTVSGNTLGNLHARTIELYDGYIEKSSSLGSIISGYNLNVYLKYRSNYDFELTSESGDYTKFYSPGLSVYYNDQKYTITNSVYDTGTNKTILTIGGLMAEAPDTNITVYIKAGMSGGSVFSLGLGEVTLYNSGNFDILSGSNLRASNGSTGTIMCGQYNVADSGASYDLICGKNNFVAYGASQNIISGYNNNALNSSQNNIVGGSKTTVTNSSNNNIISGDTITVDSSSSNIISGYFNSITSGCYRSLVIGQYNNIKEGSKNSIIDGEYNTSQSGASCNLLNGRYLTAKEGLSCCLLNGQYITSGSGSSLCIFNGEYMSSNNIKNSIINGRYYSWENSPSYVLMSGESHNLYSSKSTLLGYGIQSYGNCSLNFGAYNADVQVSSLPSWVSGETYSKGDIVKNGTKAYRCKISNSDAEFDSQKWEDDNKIKYIETVGNGFDSNDRSNARTLDWSGNEWLAGNLTLNNDSTIRSNNGVLEQSTDGGTTWYAIDSGLKNLIDGTETGSVHSITSSATGNYSIAEGTDTFAIGTNSHSGGYGTVAFGNNSHSEGYGYYFSNSLETKNLSYVSTNTYKTQGDWTRFNIGYCMIYNGYAYKITSAIKSGSYTNITVDSTNLPSLPSETIAVKFSSYSGYCGHSEGYCTSASGNYSHSEGSITIASGLCSHTEGDHSKASGNYSHVEGYYTEANGENSHVEGKNTIASSASQHVFGEYNIDDNYKSGISDWVAGTSYVVGDKVIRYNSVYQCKTDNSVTTWNSTYWDNLGSKGSYIEIVGNGNSTTRSNARTLDWDGNEMLYGNLTIGGTSGVKLRSGNNASLESSSDGGTTWNPVGGGSSTGVSYVKNVKNSGSAVTLDHTEYTVITVTDNFILSLESEDITSGATIYEYNGELSFGSTVYSIIFPLSISSIIGVSTFSANTSYIFSILNDTIIITQK